MRLEHGAGAVVKGCSGSELSIRSEEEFEFSFGRLGWIIERSTSVAAVARVSDSLCTEQSSEGPWSLDSSDLAVGWSDELPPLLDAVVADQLHPDHVVAADKLCQLVVEGFALDQIGPTKCSA